MDAKLNEKNLAALDGAANGDIDLMMTTPAQLNEPQGAGTNVKTEFPTLPLLEEAMKAAKNTYLNQTPLPPPHALRHAAPKQLHAIPTTSCDRSPVVLRELLPIIRCGIQCECL